MADMVLHAILTVLRFAHIRPSVFRFRITLVTFNCMTSVSIASSCQTCCLGGALVFLFFSTRQSYSHHSTYSDYYSFKDLGGNESKVDVLTTVTTAK